LTSDVVVMDLRIERFRLKEPFVISRGVKTHADVVHLSIGNGQVTGRGACVPYPRYGETPKGVLDQIRLACAAGVPDRATLQTRLAPGAARAAIDCALVDLEAKSAGQPAWQRLRLERPQPVVTAFTLSLGTADEMAVAAVAASGLALLKLKLGGGLADGDRMRAVRAARPDARLIADANEGWRPEDFGVLMRAAVESGLEVIEQPLPSKIDDQLARLRAEVACGSVLLCADESVHTGKDLERIAGLYDAVNIKIDKAGGLTEALAMAQETRRLGLKIMVGSMVGSSLAMAPAMLLSGLADWVDLDSPLLLAEDCALALSYSDARLLPPDPELWG